MGSHAAVIDIKDVPRQLGSKATTWATLSGVVGLAGLGVAAVLGFIEGDHFKHFSFAYLLAFAVVLAITMGNLFFIMVFHICNGKWGIVIRRVNEIVASNIGILAFLSLPIIVPVALAGFGITKWYELYEWTDPNLMANDHLLHHKQPYLNVPFFLIRCVVYFGVWYWLSTTLLRQSLKQDTSTVEESWKLRTSMRNFSCFGMILFALTVTFAAFDFLMTLTPHWFSTIYGVYFFAGSNLSAFAFLVILLRFLQAKGFLTKAVTTEHYHDLGKLMFGFVFFWGYIAFSQYMLYWYANKPEETFYYYIRSEDMSWRIYSILFAFAHLLIPFPGLLSRWVKRSPKWLLFWAFWIIFIQCWDMHYNIIPTYCQHAAHHASANANKAMEVHQAPIKPPLPFIELACIVGVAGIWLWALFNRLGKYTLVPEGDPYLKQSLAFKNF